MTRALLLLALVGCGGGASTMHLPVFTPAVDSTEVFDETMTRKSEVHEETGTLQSFHVTHRRWHRTITTLEGALVAKIAVRYELDDITDIDSNEVTTRTQGPLAGKSYVLWRDRDALEAERADGVPVTAEERALLNEEFDDLGTTARIEALITGRAWKRGEVVPIERALLEDFVPEGTDVRESTMTWLGSTGAATTFRAFVVFTTKEGYDVQATEDGTYDGSGRQIGMKGTAILRAHVGSYDVVETTEVVKTIEVE